MLVNATTDTKFVNNNFKIIVISCDAKKNLSVLTKSTWSKMALAATIHPINKFDS